MRSRVGLGVGLLALLLAAPAVSAAGGVDPSGRWRMTIDETENRQQALLKLFYEGDELHGSWHLRDRAARLEDVRLEGNKLSFSFKLITPGHSEYKLVYKGTILGDKLLGTLTSSVHTATVEGHRMPDEEEEQEQPAAPDPGAASGGS